MVSIHEIKAYAKEAHVPIMQDAGIAFILDYIKTNHVKNVLEIGSAIGYSAIQFASVSDDVHVVTIERDDTMYSEALKNVSNMKLDNRIQIIHGDALDIEVTGTFDLIFIDAAKSQYTKFFLKYSPLLNEGGVIISDNLAFHGMVADISLTKNRNTRQLVNKIKQYIEFLKNNPDFETTFYDIGDGISVSKRLK